MRGRILIVDDDPSMCATLDAGLRRRGFDPRSRASADEALLALSQEEFQAVVTDLNLRGMSGIDLCERITSSRPDVPVVVITAFGSMDSAIAAIRAGAYDFIPKPFDIEALALTLDRAVQYRALREEVKRLRQAVLGSRRFHGLLGESVAMRRLCDLVARVAASEASVLITGETGTGKELVARTIHEESPRKSGPFVALNCAAVPEQLLESELFGHVRGAFTDARTARAGLVREASGGTLFFDEIGDMPLGLQPKLLRVLQEKRVRPVGSDAEEPVDVRVIAATHRELEAEVEEGRFREDLFFRIDVVQVDVPPLRSRGGDVLLLAQHFLERFTVRSGKKVAGISGEAAQKLLAYSWPGNVRELENCMERAVALTSYERIAVEDLPEKVQSYRKSQVLLASDDPSELVSLEEVERRYILRVLESAGGNKTVAARILGLDRKTLYRKMGRYAPPPP